ncbi:MAG: PIN/TRAM domain-containing protein [Clostridium sp.]|nr:PIN/TRAM domain-containing protein [Clostridium sp.]
MFKNIVRIIVTIIGAVIGFLLGNLIVSLEYFTQYEIFSNITFKTGTIIFFIFVFAIIFFLLSSKFYSLMMSTNRIIEKSLTKITLVELLTGAIGAIILLVITFFLTRPLVDLFRPLGGIIATLLNIVAAFLGANITLKKKDEISNFIKNLAKKDSDKIIDKPKVSSDNNIYKGTPKVLDTSVIIDGRIYDICQTGFIEGKLVIPSFVLEELRHIADSADSLKRNRGRRGLDILNSIQNELDIEVEIWEEDFHGVAEVDSKLLKLATLLSGQVVTNDYNLNKVAEFQRVPVLNINELANAVKPMLLPGEEMTLLISKIGKEQNQGIGYLDDGTMIVVENGKNYIGDSIDVVVTSVLQTAAGRMIFAKPKLN